MSGKTLVFTFGKFNVPTKQHADLVKFIKESANDSNADSLILLHNTRISLKRLRDTFPDIAFKKWVMNPAMKMDENVISMFKTINRNYDDIVFVCDKNNVDLCKQFFAENNGKHFNFTSVSVISSNMSDPDESDSGEIPMFIKDKNRDKYYRKEIFNVGDKVICDGKIYEVAKRGTNHLMLLAEGGNELIAKFVKDVKEYKPSRISRSQARKLFESVKKITGNDRPQDVKTTGDLVNFALEYITTRPFTLEILKNLNECLDRADKYGVNYDKSLVPGKILEIRETENNILNEKKSSCKCPKCNCVKCKCKAPKKETTPRFKNVIDRKTDLIKKIAAKNMIKSRYM